MQIRPASLRTMMRMVVVAVVQLFCSKPNASAICAWDSQLTSLIINNQIFRLQNMMFEFNGCFCSKKEKK